MRTAEQVVNEINSARGDGDEQGLRNTAALLEQLQAWPTCPVVHVAGTNGKGSVCAMLSSVLTAAGYRTGLYTSPFLQTYRERIRINGEPVSEELLAEYGNETLDAAAQMSREKGYRNTPFELGTVLALLTFLQEKTDIIILETGLGGRLDPTNVIPSPTVCAVTAIGMDHMQLLGNSLPEIAREKAGIFKKSAPAICYPPASEEVKKVFSDAAAKCGTTVTLLKRDQVRIRMTDAFGSDADYQVAGRVWNNIRISLPGDHQTLNALTALEVLDKLEKAGVRIPKDAVCRGMKDTFWPGRLEWHGNILMDGAHNAQGVSAFASFVQKHLEGKQRILLTGVLKEKLTDEMLDGLSMVADEAVTVTPDSPRALRAEELSKMLAQKGMNVHTANTLEEGLTKALQLAGTKGIVLATGSLYFIGALRSILGLKP